MVEHIPAQLGAKPHSRFRCKILGCQGAGEPQYAEKHKQTSHFPNIWDVCVLDVYKRQSSTFLPLTSDSQNPYHHLKITSRLTISIY